MKKVLTKPYVNHILISVTVPIIDLRGVTMIKRSRQREAIQQCLIGRFDHPTAEMVYMSIKDEFPNISLGTVYRNLSLLADLGAIQKITVSGGPDRFDGNPKLHYHFGCRSCGCVMDLDLPQQDQLNQLALAHFDGIIEMHTIQFFGLCPDCARKQTS